MNPLSNRINIWLFFYALIVSYFIICFNFKLKLASNIPIEHYIYPHVKHSSLNFMPLRHWLHNVSPHWGHCSVFGSAFSKAWFKYIFLSSEKWCGHFHVTCRVPLLHAWYQSFTFVLLTDMKYLRNKASVEIEICLKLGFQWNQTWLTFYIK